MRLLTNKSPNKKILKYTFFTMRLLTNKSPNKQVLKCAFSSVPFLKIYRHFFIFHHHQPNKFNFFSHKAKFYFFLFTDLVALLAILLVVVQQCGFDPRQGCLYTGTVGL